jgi:serine/threonine protein phosphatase 1
VARLLALGDIHGCVHALDAVLTAAEVGPDDTLIVLGDVIDYGRESAEVVERLLQLRGDCELICIRGNHEEMLLGSLENERLRSQWLNVGGMETLNSYQFCGGIDAVPQSHLNFLSEFRDYYENGSFVFTHANYDADLEFGDQLPHALRWQLLEPPWTGPHVSGKTIVVGHSEMPAREVLDLGHIVCLDTGCRSYGWLTLWDAETGQTWQASKWGALREDAGSEETADLRRARNLLRAGGHSTALV